MVSAIFKHTNDKIYHKILFKNVFNPGLNVYIFSYKLHLLQWIWTNPHSQKACMVTLELFRISTSFATVPPPPPPFPKKNIVFPLKITAKTATKSFGSEITPTPFRSFQKIHPKWSIESSLSCLLCFIILILNTLMILKIFLSSTDITFRWLCRRRRSIQADIISVLRPDSTLENIAQIAQIAVYDCSDSILEIALYDCSDSSLKNIDQNCSDCFLWLLRFHTCYLKEECFKKYIAEVVDV